MCDELNVDLYFNGHIHDYFRATVDGEGNKAEVGSGTTFVTTSPMGMKFDEYGGEIDKVLDFQTGGSDDQRQYLTYVEVTEEGVTVTAYQRTEAGDANLKKCADYTVIDTFSIRKGQPQEKESEPEPDQKQDPAPQPEPEPAPEKHTLRYVLGGAALLAVIVLAVVLLRKRKK